MNNPSHSDVIIGSKIALAMAHAKGSPIRAQFGQSAEGKQLKAAKMSRRCEAIKKRSRQLLDEMRAQDLALTAESTRIKINGAADGTDIMATVVAMMVEHQSALHARIEKMLDEVMHLIHSDRTP